MATGNVGIWHFATPSATADIRPFQTFDARAHGGQLCLLPAISEMASRRRTFHWTSFGTQALLWVTTQRLSPLPLPGLSSPPGGLRSVQAPDWPATATEGERPMATIGADQGTES